MADVIDERLARKGVGEPREGVAQQLRVSHKLWADNKAALKDAGFPEESGARLATLAEELDQTTAKQADARGVSKSKAQAEVNARVEGKRLKRKITNVVRVALRNKPVEGVTEESFQAGGPLGRNTAKVSSYFSKISAAAAKADASFASYFGGQKISALIAAAKKKLDDADAMQEVALGALPADTQKVYEAKGRGVELIEELNAVAKNAFDGNAGLTGQFNKDVLLRAREAQAKDARKEETLADGVPANPT